MIEVVGLSKQYGDIQALKDVTFTVRRGEVLTILGPNGSGKTTLLKILAALETPSEGEVRFDGLKVDESNASDTRRRASMVFQRTVMLRGSVYDNIAYGLRMRGVAEEKIDSKVKELLETVGLETLERRRAKSLSGGEQQRLSLARALVLDSELLLLDEPTANLDPESLSIVKDVIRRMNKERKITVVMATHNLLQAEELSERVILLDGGMVVEEARPGGLLRAPSPRMARFTRSENVFTGDSKVVDGVSHVDVGEGVVVRATFDLEGRVTIYVGPEDIIVSRGRLESSARNTLRGSVVSVEGLNSVVRLRVDVGRVFMAQITRRSLAEMGLNVGEEVYLTFKASSVQLL